MKKSIGILLICILMFSLVACGGGNDHSSSKNTDKNTSETSSQNPSNSIKIPQDIYDFDMDSQDFIKFGPTKESSTLPIATQDAIDGSLLELVTTKFSGRRVYQKADINNGTVADFDVLYIILEYEDDDGDKEKAKKNLDSFMEDVAMINLKSMDKLLEKGYREVIYLLNIDTYFTKVNFYFEPKDGKLELTFVQATGIYEEVSAK